MGRNCRHLGVLPGPVLSHAPPGRLLGGLPYTAERDCGGCNALLGLRVLNLASRSESAAGQVIGSRNGDPWLSWLRCNMPDPLVLAAMDRVPLHPAEPTVLNDVIDNILAPRIPRDSAGRDACTPCQPGTSASDVRPCTLDTSYSEAPVPRSLIYHWCECSCSQASRRAFYSWNRPALLAPAVPKRDVIVPQIIPTRPNHPTCTSYNASSEKKNVQKW